MMRWPLTVAAAGLALGVGTAPFDAEAVRWINATGGPLDGLWLALHSWVPTVLLTSALLVGFWFLIKGTDPTARRVGLGLMVAPLAASRCVALLKDWAARPRPQAVLDDLRVVVEDAEHRSFPSGHVTTVTVVVLAAWPLLPRPLRGVAFALIPLMAWDRMALGVHYPSDTLGGVVLGALMVAGTIFLIGRRDPVVPHGWMPVVAWVLFLLLTAGGPSPGRPLDPVTLEKIPPLRLSPHPSRWFLEPWVGPVLELGWIPNLRTHLAWGLIPLGLVVVASFVAARRGRPQFLALLLVWGVGTGLVAWRGWAQPDRFRSSDPGMFLDLHVHGSDPVDGAAPAAIQRQRLERRGVHVLAFTNHDAAPPVPDAMPGLEWSGGRHGDETFLHLLVLGGDGAFDAVNAHRVPRLVPGEGSTHRRLVGRAVQAARDAGALVLVAHYPSTALAMERAGTLEHLPSPAELVAFGVDGFEVATRTILVEPAGRKLLEEIDGLCREHGLLRVASSDDHGFPVGSPAITWIPGDFPSEPSARRAAAFEHLKNRGVVVPALWTRGRRPSEAPAALGPWVAVARYFMGLPWSGRISWALWGTLALAWCRRGRRG